MAINLSCECLGSIVGEEVRACMHWTDKIKFCLAVQKSRQNLSLPNFQFGNRGRT